MLFVNQIMVDNYAAFLIARQPVGRASDSMIVSADLFIVVGLDQRFLSAAWSTGVQLVFLCFAPDFQ